MIWWWCSQTNEGTKRKATKMTAQNTLAIGFVSGDAVEKGPFTNVMLVVGDTAVDGSAYIATDDDGHPVSLSLRFTIDKDAPAHLLALLSKAGVPLRTRTQWQWYGGATQPVGRKGSRWTVGGPRVTTTTQPQRGRVASGNGFADSKLTATQKRARTMLANMSPEERAAVLG